MTSSPWKGLPGTLTGSSNYVMREAKADVVEANRTSIPAKAKNSSAMFSTSKMTKVKTPHVSIALKKPVVNQGGCHRNNRNSTRLFITQVMSSGAKHED